MLGFVKVGPIVGKLLIFEVFYELKKLKNSFYFCFECGNDTGHSSTFKISNVEVCQVVNLH